MLRVKNLQTKADLLLKTSQSMQKVYERYVRAVSDADLYQRIRHTHSGYRSRVDNEDVVSLSVGLAKDSNEVSEHVKSMREDIYVLVKTIRDAKEISDKKASRDKHLRIFVKSLKIFNIGVGVSASVSQLAPQPAGLAATVALGTAAVLITSATEATDRYRIGKRKVPCSLILILTDALIAHYGETEFDAALKVVEKDIPDALKKADLTLSSFRACHKHMTLDMSVREAYRTSPNDADSRRKARQENSLQIDGLPSFLPSTRSTLF